MPESHPSVDPDVAALLDANEAFYDALEARDLDAMSDVWHHGDEVICTHPGWATLRGWAAVSASWFAIFQGADGMQVILTEAHPTVQGDVGWVAIDENLLFGPHAQTVAALNVFTRVDGRWLLAVHHGAGVTGA